MKPLIEHLKELRRRFIIILVFFFISFIIGIPLSPYIIKKIVKDLALKNITLVSLTPIEFIHTQLKVAFFFALFLSVPLIIYQIILFLKPGAKRKEIIAIKYFLPSFLLLFMVGAYFGYSLFLKIALLFLASLSSLANVYNMWSIYQFISFILVTCLSLGIIFQFPLLLIILKALNLIDEKILAKKRPYIYVAVFALAALLTPPDVITQILIALPLILLYELSLFVMRLV